MRLRLLFHTVQRGEYLGQIAELYSVTIDQILQANNIANPNTVYPGQDLQIWTSDLSVANVEEPEVATESETVEEPATDFATNAPAEAESGEQVVHTVARGEYLSSIARSYGIPWTTIAEAKQHYRPESRHPRHTACHSRG